MLTIITPIHCMSKKSYLFDRILWFIENSFCSEEICRIVVDHSSPKFIADELEKKCEKKGINYIRLEKYGRLFSAGECRNIGVSHAETEFVTFQDIDLYASDEIYYRVLNKLKNMKFYNELKIIPCLYLSEKLSNKILNGLNSGDQLEPSFESTYDLYLGADPEVLMYAPVTSMIIVKRTFFMENGGNNLSFHGHGYEDFEVLHRLSTLSNKFIKPVDYYNHNYKYHSSEYKGYRTYFSLFGRPLMGEGLFFVHLWHPKNENNQYVTSNRSNRNLFDKLIREFDKEQKQPCPLNSLVCSEKTLVLAPKNGKTVEVIRIAIPYLGNVIYAHDKDFKDTKEFFDFIKKNNIVRVLFFNSYGNDHRYELYQLCLHKSIRTINFDRGALPDSWFFDPYGFNFSSDSYSQKRWDKELDYDDKIKIEQYIHNTLISDKELEANGARIGDYAFKAKYNIQDQKVLFIPLQRPNDSVVKYFSDQVSSMDMFVEEVKKLADSLKDDNWIICIKPHPLEKQLTDEFTSENIKVLSHKDNFKDVISVCSAVFVINSGVGVYSLMYDKPTFNIGNAFYSHVGLSNKVSNFDELKCKLQQPLDEQKPIRKKVLRFINYLVNDFYSFGTTVYKQKVNKKDNSTTNVATSIDFTILRIPNIKNSSLENIYIRRRTEPFNLSSPYYDYYRSWINMRDLLNKYQNEQNKSNVKIEKLSLQLQELQKNLNLRVKSTQEKICEVPIENDNKANFKKGSKKMAKLKRDPKAFFIDAYKNFILKFKR